MLRNHPHRPHARPHHPAFTLIELLVVIAIIALLIGILLPALGAARDSAKKLKCLTHVRSMGTAFTMYADDHRDWYPVIPMTDPSRLWLDKQYTAGGVAGLFSLFQLGDGSGSIDPPVVEGDTGFVGSPTGGVARYVNGEDTPLMRNYIGSLEILTCPSDRLDYYWRNYHASDSHVISEADAVKVPEAPTNEQEVIHYNISYLYIAGLKQVEPSIQFSPPLWGDETNSADVKFGSWYGWDWFANEPGTTTESDPVRDFGFNPETGYAKDDNHGDEGGNFVRADGSANFIAENPQRAFFMRPHEVEEGESMDPRSVNIIDPGRSNRLQTID